MAALVRGDVGDFVRTTIDRIEDQRARLRVVDVRSQHRSAAVDGPAEARGARNGAVDADDGRRFAAEAEAVHEKEVDLVSRRGQREELPQLAARATIVGGQESAKLALRPRRQIVDRNLSQTQTRACIDLRKPLRHPGKVRVRDGSGRRSGDDIERDVDGARRRGYARLEQHLDIVRAAGARARRTVVCMLGVTALQREIVHEEFPLPRKQAARERRVRQKRRRVRYRHHACPG